ncbi:MULTISPECIES: hypothetical protein [unclassified Leptolyngbya]|uniref:hypothetical protein n=1 Tax=unclassified Leptolyngbya TaxID=2650499 RepID=UPI0016852824|nr:MULTISPECIES: hypothetical protein [unclassified Leptolyngbya]MBD1913017.1 hypothetical protein [Leptolyngbya sp. FACHB-8]MBD2154482.1 hypothetical protein [Leptolyngbya sp. FACHB-16]
MELTNSSYPVRAFIRHKAEMKIRQAEAAETFCPHVDRMLLKDLATTLFRSQLGTAIYTAYPTRVEAEAIEERFAEELAQTYQHIKQQQTNPDIQKLNQLLE